MKVSLGLTFIGCLKDDRTAKARDDFLGRQVSEVTEIWESYRTKVGVSTLPHCDIPIKVT